MYQGLAGQVSRDEYLMGRPIDKQITDQYEEAESGPSAETGLLPGSIFNPTTPASNLDLAAKIREDPLFQIRLACLLTFVICLETGINVANCLIHVFLYFAENVKRKKREKS